MAKIAFPLGFKIVENTGLSNTGTPIDERLVFPSQTDRTNYIDNFFYEGLLSYTIGLPYHESGVTSNAGFYYRNSANNWVGLNADTLDDKHASGTMDSGSTSTSNPNTGINIVDHVNYLYTLTSAISTSRAWKAPVTNFADLATTYPTPMIGWTALVTSENAIYTYNGSIWVKTGGNVAMLSSTVSGIVSNTWYTTLYVIVSNPYDYRNKNLFGGVSIKNNGSNVTNSPVAANTQQDSFILNFTGALTATVLGNTITINGTGGGGVTSINDNFAKWDQANQYYRFYTDKTEAGGSLSGGKLYGGTDNPLNNTRLNYDGYFYATKLYTGGVEVQPILPSQTGNNGKYLQTDGTNLSWQPITAITGIQTPVSLVYNITDNTTTVVTIPVLYNLYAIHSITVNGIEFYQTTHFTISGNNITFNDNIPYDSNMGDTIVKVVFIQNPTQTIAETLSILTDATMVTFDPTGSPLVSTNVQDAVKEVALNVGLALGETSTTAYRGDRGKIAYDHSQLISGNPHNVTKTDVGLGNVANVDTTNPSNITQDSTHRFVTDTEKSTWNSKQDSLGFTPENVANKATSLITNDDVHYPTTKAVKTITDTKETGLGNPTSDGYVLSSTTSGTRSWIPPGGGVTGTDGNVVIILNNQPVDSGLSYALILAGL